MHDTCHPPPGAATCHPRMGSLLGQHAVLPLPRYTYVVTRDIACLGCFSCLRAITTKPPSLVQWGLVRTVVRSDGLPAKDRTSLAPLTPQAPESPQRSELWCDFFDAPDLIPSVEPCQHIRQLEVRVGVGVFEAHFGDSKRTTYLTGTIAMPNSVDDETARWYRATKVHHGLSHHAYFRG